MVASENSSQLQKLESELKLAKALITQSEPWVEQLRTQLGRVPSEKDALPRVCSFFALWSFHLLQGIVRLVESKLYSSSFLLLRSLIELHLELSFILHRDCSKRAAEYLNSGKESRTPYRAQPGFEQFGSLGVRAGSCGMGELYRKTYLSLSYYSHVRVKGILAAKPGSEKNFGEAMACLLVAQAMLVKIIRQISKVFRQPLPELLTREYSSRLRRYKQLIQKQEEAIARKTPKPQPR